MEIEFDKMIGLNSNFALIRCEYLVFNRWHASRVLSEGKERKERKEKEREKLRVGGKVCCHGR